MRAMSADHLYYGGSKHVWNVRKLLPDYSAQHPRRQPSSYSSSWEPEISSDRRIIIFFLITTLYFCIYCYRGTALFSYLWLTFWNFPSTFVWTPSMETQNTTTDWAWGCWEQPLENPITKWGHSIKIDLGKESVRMRRGFNRLRNTRNGRLMF
jgi:hypothetical protein